MIADFGTAGFLAVFASFLAAAGAARLGRAPPEGGRIGCIDGLRGYLALAVLTHHSNCPGFGWGGVW